MRMYLQFFGGRSSAGGNSVSANVANTATKSKSSPEITKSTRKPTFEEINSLPMGAAYMSPGGTIYVKQNKAANADWVPYTSETGTGYMKTSSELIELMKDKNFTKLGNNDTYRGAGGYRPTSNVFEQAKPLRKAAAAERKKRQAEKKKSKK